MNKINPPVEIYPSQLDAFKLKAKELASAISETYSIKKLSSFKRNDYLSIALGYKGHPDLIESTKFRQASDKETPLVLFLPSNIQNSIARVFSQKINELSENDILVVCKQLSWTEAKSIFPQTSIEDIKKASPEEVEAVLSNINSGIKLLMKEPSSDDNSQYGHVFESQVAEVDMMDVINDNPVTIVDTSNLDNKTLRKQLSVLFGGDLAKVAGKITMMAFEERKRLIRLNELEHPKQLTHVCSHKYHDSFHSEETGITDFHCLVCDHKWSENETLSQKPFKNFKRIAHGCKFY